MDAVQQSIAYTVAYYGLLHRSDVAQCLTDYAQFTVPYGPNEDDRAGDQFYNHVPRMLISQFVKDRTSPADDLRWLFDVPTLAEQSTHCAEIFQKAAENYAVYLRQCEKTAAELAEERLLLRERGSGTRNSVDAGLQGAGATAQPVVESVSTAALLACARAGLGITLLPRSLVVTDLERGDLRELAVEDGGFHRSYFLVRHRSKYLTDGMKRVIRVLREHLGGEQP